MDVPTDRPTDRPEEWRNRYWIPIKNKNQDRRRRRRRVQNCWKIVDNIRNWNCWIRNDDNEQLLKPKRRTQQGRRRRRRKHTTAKSFHRNRSRNCARGDDDDDDLRDLETVSRISMRTGFLRSSEFMGPHFLALDSSTLRQS